MASQSGKPLPTCSENGGSMIDFLVEFRRECRRNDSATRLLILSYAVSLKGWALIRSSVRGFHNRLPHRQVIAFIGLDHLLTEPEALRAMNEAGVAVNVISRWPNTFHPKVFAFLGTDTIAILSGSNNLTKRGLTSNYEFAARIDIENTRPSRFMEWLDRVERVAEPLSPRRLASYLSEYGSARRLRRPFIATTRDRIRQLTGKSSPAARRFTTAIVEVMDRETGTEGTQIQIPMEIVRTFFGLKANTSRSFVVKNDDTGDRRSLKLTAFNNNTARLSLFEVNREARPCVLELWWQGAELHFRVVRQATNPGEYKRHMDVCVLQTRAGS